MTFFDFRQERALNLQSTYEERFMRKIEPEPNSGCWLWLGNLGPGTSWRGQFKGPRGVIKAHRFAYELFRGPIDQNKELDHLCRIPACVNPQHLEMVTHHENIMRAVPWIKRQTHCFRGHEYAVHSTRRRDGQHYCRACRHERWLRDAE
jgi:HNH endonuclease